MKPRAAFAASGMAMVLGGALSFAGAASAADQSASAPPASTASAVTTADAPDGRAPAAPETARKDKDPATGDRAAKPKPKPKRRAGLVYGEPSLAMDPDPFLALTSPAVGLVYGIPRRQ